MAKVTTALFGELAILPFPAIIPVSETLSFLTDVMESYNGTEQRVELRGKPRQFLEYQVPLKPSNDASAWNTAYGAIRKEWGIPIWHDTQYIGPVTAGATSIACDTVHYDLRDSSLAMLFDICGKWQVLEISTITDSLINLTTATALFRDAYLIPVRIGNVIGDIDKTTNGYNGGMHITYSVSDTDGYTPSAPTQYLGDDIYYDLPLTQDSGIDTKFSQRQDVIDFELGVVEYRTPWNHAKFGKPYRQLMTTPQERKQFRDFIFRRVGKSKVFWLPTGENNLRITNTGTITNLLQVNRDSYPEYGLQRTHIAIKAGAVWYPRVISAPTILDANTMQLTLSSAVNIPASSVENVCYLGLNRLNTDSIEFAYNAPLVAECSVQILELTP